MRAVTKDKFFAFIGKTDTRTSIRGKYPYTSLFIDKRTRKMVGKVVDHRFSPSEYMIEEETA